MNQIYRRLFTIRGAIRFSAAAFLGRLPAGMIGFAAILCIGISAGAVEVIVVARADLFGSRHLAGFLMATLALSSILAGFWYGARTFKLSPPHLWIRCLGFLVLALIPFAFATSLWLLMLTLFIAGLLIAPTSIAGQVLTEQVLPANQLNEGMNIIVTAMILGMALGGWIAGLLIDAVGAVLSGWLPAVATSASLVITASCARSLTASD